MKRIVNISIFTLLLLIFGSFMFTFQVRQDEVAFLSTSGGTPVEHEGPAFRFRWPWPFQRLYKFDKRVHVVETDYEEMSTGENESTVVMQFYFGWKIKDKGASSFFRTYKGGKGSDAEQRVKHAEDKLSEKVQNTGKEEVQKLGSSSRLARRQDDNGTLESLEQRIKTAVQMQLDNQVTDNKRGAGVEIVFVGVRRVGLPQKNLDTALESMVKEWQSEADLVKQQADEEARDILARAESARMKAIAEAETSADIAVKAQIQDAQKDMEQLKKNKELAIFLMQMESIKKSVRGDSTLILDETMGPFPFLQGVTPELKPAPEGGE